MLGLSATMERKDGTTSVFKMFLGNIDGLEEIENLCKALSRFANAAGEVLIFGIREDKEKKDFII